MVACQENCDGILRSPERGIPPRGLILETDGRRGVKGSIVCGINPGRALAREASALREAGATYEAVLRSWDEQAIKDVPYYQRLRSFVTGVGLFGPILWTNLAKCQNRSETSRLSTNDHPDTFRKCFVAFLENELGICPAEWPIIAAGREVYLALLFLCPNRTIIGVPHPTGPYARNQFQNLFLSGWKLRPKVQSKVVRLLEQPTHGAIRLQS